MEKIQEDWSVNAKREKRYDKINEIIGQLTLVEKYIRIRLINGTLQKDEDALHILLDQHRDAVIDLGSHLESLKILDREDLEEYVENEECGGCVDCDMRADADDDCEAINLVEDANEESVENEDDCVCKQISDDNILEMLLRIWSNIRDLYSEDVVFIKCKQFHITFDRDIDNLESAISDVPYYIFEDHQFACFDEDNFHKLKQRIDDNGNIAYNFVNYDNDTIATKLN